jgi:hypothetical protein
MVFRHGLAVRCSGSRKQLAQVSLEQFAARVLGQANISFFKCQEAGHYSMLEAPVITASEIEKFVASASQ